MENSNAILAENKKLKRKIKFLQQSLHQFNSIKTKYDILIKKLEEKDKNLELMNLKLEDLVKERTKELEEINKKLQQHLKIMEDVSIKDALTGVRNRRSFDEIFSREFARAKRQGYNFNFLLLDVDNFKKYNDYYGHKKGDEVLKTIGEVLLSISQRANDFVFRYGGEEFVYISCFLNEEETLTLSNKILEQISAKRIGHIKNGRYNIVTVSIGGMIATNMYKDNKEKIFEIADKNLYKAKDRGRNSVVLSKI